MRDDERRISARAETQKAVNFDSSNFPFLLCYLYRTSDYVGPYASPDLGRSSAGVGMDGRGSCRC